MCGRHSLFVGWVHALAQNPNHFFTPHLLQQTCSANTKQFGGVSSPASKRSAAFIYTGARSSRPALAAPCISTRPIRREIAAAPAASVAGEINLSTAQPGAHIQYTVCNVCCACDVTVMFMSYSYHKYRNTYYNILKNGRGSQIVTAVLLY